MTGIANPLFFVGVVENNDDPRFESRVQVRALGIHGTKKEVPTEMLPWSILAKGDYDANGAIGSGIPEINNFVFGVMLDGRDAQQPLILGLIPTQFATKWGEPGGPGELWGNVPPTPAGEITSRSTAPEQFGQPQSDRLSRAENLEETYVLQQEMGRTMNIPSADGGTFSEPATAYDASPTFNKVIKVGDSSIEIDGSPGSERIMIHHGEGSYIQIDANGLTTEKTVDDKYEIIDGKQHVSAGRGSNVTIVGNAYVKVIGNKTEEITGDLQTLVHGNHLLSVGGQSTHQAGVQLQFRAADIKTEANVGTFSIKAAKEMQIDAGQGVYFKSNKIWMEASDTFNVKGNEMFINGTSDFNIKGDAVLVLGSDGLVHVRGTTVHIDDNVNMANGDALNASAAEGSKGASGVEAPEPPTQSTDIGGSSGQHDPSSRGTAGAASQDDRETSNGNNSNSSYPVGEISAVLQSHATPLLEYIGNLESPRGYDAVLSEISQSRQPPKQLTTMTIQEVLDWQERIDNGPQTSEAAGRYQIVEDTLRGYNNDNYSSRQAALAAGRGEPGLWERAGLSIGDLYNKLNQDKLGLALIEKRGLSKYLNDEISRDEFANNLANEFASLPIISGPRAGESVYKGVGTNASLGAETADGKIQGIRDAIEAVKARATASATAVPPGDATNTQGGAQ